MPDSLAEAALGGVWLAEQGSRTGFDAERPGGAARPCFPGQPVEGIGRQMDPSRSRGRLDELDHAPVVGHHLGRIRAGAAGGGERLVVAPGLAIDRAAHIVSLRILRMLLDHLAERSQV